MASAETTRVSQVEVLKALDARIVGMQKEIEDKQKVLSALKRDRRRIASNAGMEE
jgi:hypothetical protein